MEKSIGPINSIVLARAGESDKIYIKDNASIQENGLCEVMISENQIMNFNDRDTYLKELSEKLFGVEYYLNDFVSTGIMYYDLLDMYNVEIYGKTYNCLMLNDEQNITQGLEENIHTDRPEKSETDYTKADKTDRKINQTTLIVDKQNQSIEALITNNNELNQKTTQLRLDVDKIEGEISDIADVTITAEGNGTITLENINESEPIMIKIHPQTVDITSLYPRDDLYPSDELFPHNRELLLKNTTDDTTIIYNLPCDLYYLNGIYDEFILDYSEQKCYVIHRIEVVNGVKQFKAIETTENFEYPIIKLTEGDYTITIPYALTSYIYARLMTKNIYTSQFATKVEMNTKISQTATDITLATNKKLEDYSTTTEMNSAITVKANEINSVVSTKVGENEIISKINQSAEQIQIKADKIDINGKAVNFRTEITDVIGPFTNEDVLKVQRYVVGLGTLTPDELIRYDVTKDGKISTRDVYFMQKAINNGGYYSFNGIFQINPYSHTQSISLYDKNYNKYDCILSLMQSYLSNLSTNNLNVEGQLVVTNIAGEMFTQENDNVFELYIDGRIRATNKVICETLEQTSLATQKKNFERLQDNALETLKQIDIYKYNLKSEKDTDKKHIGFVIGDNFNYSKEVTSLDNQGVDNYSFTSLCCKAIQELSTKVEELENKIKEMEGNNG